MPICPVCDRNSTAQIFSKFNCEYFRCECGFVFIAPRPSEAELQAKYRRHGDEYWTSDTMLKFAFSPTKSRREIRFVRSFIQRGTLLDIGCSTGSFVKAASESGFDAEGVDISAPAVACGKQFGLSLHTLDVLKDNPPGAPYDVVTLWATLEHLPDPLRHLRRARELLKPGGLLFVSVPNYAGVAQKTLGKWDRYVGIDHLNYFRIPVLRETLERAGFRYQGETTYGFNPLVLWLDFTNRGVKSLEIQDMQGDASATLKLKNSHVRHIQHLAEALLNIFRLADVIGMCAQA